MLARVEFSAPSKTSRRSRSSTTPSGATKSRARPQLLARCAQRAGQALDNCLPVRFRANEHAHDIGQHNPTVVRNIAVLCRSVANARYRRQTLARLIDGGDDQVIECFLPRRGRRIERFQQRRVGVIVGARDHDVVGRNAAARRDSGDRYPGIGRPAWCTGRPRTIARRVSPCSITNARAQQSSCRPSTATGAPPPL